jgi:hypothetical protein
MCRARRTYREACEHTYRVACRTSVVVATSGVVAAEADSGCVVRHRPEHDCEDRRSAISTGLVMNRQLEQAACPLLRICPRPPQGSSLDHRTELQGTMTGTRPDPAAAGAGYREAEYSTRHSNRHDA